MPVAVVPVARICVAKSGYEPDGSDPVVYVTPSHPIKLTVPAVPPMVMALTREESGEPSEGVTAKAPNAELSMPGCVSVKYGMICPHGLRCYNITGARAL